MHLRFHGATGGTTGSCHELAFDGRTVLLDCGLFQGRRQESYERNSRFAVDASTVDAVVLSHAHIDHSGKLPMLVKLGFRGAIHATAATRDLARALLYDCAKILASDAEFMNRRLAADRGRLDPKDEILPLYGEDEVRATLERCVPHGYGAWFDVVPGLRVRFHDAGHILGSAWIEAEVRERGRSLRLVFTGDYGRKGLPILRDPEPLAPCDVLVTETTYGNRSHPSTGAGGEALLEAVRRLERRGRGRLLIPAFAVGRTQNLLYVLARGVHDGSIPPVDVVVDSPLATAATAILVDHTELFDREALAEYRRYEAEPAFRDRLRFTASVDESKALNRDPRPIVVIAASGMCESGRILHHLAWNLPSPDTEVVIVGFQAEHTLGRRLVEGRNPVRLLGREVEVRARVTPMLGFSAHADREELLAALAPLARASDPRTFLVHGEDTARVPFEALLRERGFTRIELPSDARTWAL
ncbi:MAG: MBL fold metallo-hydrolase [Planctomycetes bacterium]|nr:MBL fold metallo-hydrolase [Planctomycetota bacterium]